jgi:hypothetical protein
MSEIIWVDELYLVQYLELRRTIASFQNRVCSMDEYLRTEIERISTVFFEFCEKILCKKLVDLEKLRSALCLVKQDLFGLSSNFEDQEQLLFFIMYDSCYETCLEQLQPYLN